MSDFTLYAVGGFLSRGGAQTSPATPATDGQSVSSGASGLQAVATVVQTTFPAIAGSQPGMAVNGLGNLAIATSLAAAQVAGVLPPSDSQDLLAPPRTFIELLASGSINLTANEQQLLTENSAAFVANTYYYLSATTAGKLTSVKPSTPGQIVIRVLLAIKGTLAVIQVGEPTVVPGG